MVLVALPRTMPGTRLLDGSASASLPDIPSTGRTRRPAQHHVLKNSPGRGCFASGNRRTEAMRHPSGCSWLPCRLPGQSASSHPSSPAVRFLRSSICIQARGERFRLRASRPSSRWAIRAASGHHLRLNELEKFLIRDHGLVAIRLDEHRLDGREAVLDGPLPRTARSRRTNGPFNGCPCRP